MHKFNIIWKIGLYTKETEKFQLLQTSLKLNPNYKTSLTLLNLIEKIKKIQNFLSNARKDSSTNFLWIFKCARALGKLSVA